ncbi:MAG: DUF2141 domain-containing protein [Bacteroidales bacterium]|nr:DUF2141 domain-containing protein [Bacteroidales bacterium]
MTDEKIMINICNKFHKALLTIILLGITTIIFGSTSSLKVIINGLESSNGHVRLKILNADGSIHSKYVLTIKDKKCTFTLNDIKAGKYVIKYYHDENDNEETDNNLFGIQKEGFGFSNKPAFKIRTPGV